MMSLDAKPCPITDKLTQYLASLPSRPLPGPVAAKARLHVLDTFAAIVSGTKLKAGKAAIKLVTGLGGHPEATLFATDHTTSAYHAALANALAAHADETDDSHLWGRFHPGCGIVPAAFAMAERAQASGALFLQAVATGYDIGTRFTMALGLSAPDDGTHSTHCLAANFGATAAAATIPGFNDAQWGYVISYAVQQASGIRYWHRDTDHVEKSFDFGAMGARNGVYAALMVESGFTGVRGVLTGRHSYLDAFGLSPTPEALTDELGERYEITRASIKKWCVGSPIQSALDAMVALMSAHSIGADDVDDIIAHMPDDRINIVNDRDMPDVCLQYLLATALLDGTVSFEAAHDHARMTAPDIQAIRNRITVVPSADLTAARPERQAIIELVLKDGRKVSHHAKAVRGTPDDPMSDAEVEDKARDLMTPILGSGKTDELIAATRELAAMTDVTALRPLLQV